MMRTGLTMERLEINCAVGGRGRQSKRTGELVIHNF